MQPDNISPKVKNTNHQPKIDGKEIIIEATFCAYELPKLEKDFLNEPYWKTTLPDKLRLISGKTTLRIEEGYFDKGQNSFAYRAIDEGRGGRKMILKVSKYDLDSEQDYTDAMLRLTTSAYAQ